MSGAMSDEALFKAGRLCVVGNVNRDIKVVGLRPSPALFDDGETPGREIIETIGGGGANSACAAAALGARTVFLGKVGTDALGQRLIEVMRRHGVDVRVAQDSRHATGTTIALGFDTGTRHFISCLPNNEALTYEDLDLPGLVGCNHLLRADVWFSESMLAAGNAQLFQEARRHGLTISLDINWDPRWQVAPAADNARRKAQLRSVLPLVDLVHGNVRELTMFADCPDLTTALGQIIAWGARAIVVHMGYLGAGYFQDGQLIADKPTLVHHVQNATGTGDVLSLCMILLHQNQELTVPEKLRLANRVVAEFMAGDRVLIPEL
jgi:sugar/nucleoside kinase (ribokinase family)